MRLFVTSLCIFIAGVAAAQDPCGVKSESIKFDVFAHPGGLGMMIGAGGAAPHHVQIDTGSIGIVVGYMHIGGHPTPVPDKLLKQWGVPNYILYNSSGKVKVGTWVYTSIELSDKNKHSVTIPSIPVLSVYKTCQIATGTFPPPPSCLTPPPRHLPKVDCKAKPRPPLCGLGMMGVGFDRGAGMGTSAMNPFLHLPQMDADPPTMQRGYIITARKGITLGMTPGEIAGFKFLPLTSTGTPGEWREAHGCVAITGGGIINPGQEVCGDILMDTGVDRMYLTYAKGFPKFHPRIPASGDFLWNCPPPIDEVAQRCTIHGDASRAGVTVTWPGTFTYSVSAPAKFVSTGTNPMFVRVRHVSTPLPNPNEDVFVNTSRQLLYEADYLYDATCGRVGFRPLPPKR